MTNVEITDEVLDAAAKAFAAARIEDWEDLPPEVQQVAWADFREAMLAALEAVLPYLTSQPECGAMDRTGQRRCVFTPGHHEVDAWTSHGDRGGWTWNDQPAEVKS